MAAQGTTTNGKCLLPFKTGAFLAGAPVRPVVLEYGADRVSAAWESINFVWHALLLLANPTHSVTAYEVRHQKCLQCQLGAQRANSMQVQCMFTVSSVQRVCQRSSKLHRNAALLFVLPRQVRSSACLGS